ncbi:MAG: serine dehydratase subunit alpha family protein [Clostridium sp.]|uniref:L-cysteine desulfidase family protein n=1 Tax=Clostridium sp. TaxID=1506 RepID=UPI0025C1CAAA|nr:L-serine ammonia-lyase, iron-sulfur-dependent, subunit alpha [Clostridium sp.]MBS4955919.1 serine dehydratase subunit alpha family protein [Clostridium sp.]
MKKDKYNDYLQILKEELVPAMGCTEPIAIAYAAAKARDVLGKMPEKVIAKCSGNIIKNAMCVTVPNTGELVGIKASAIIGILAGNSSKELEVISEVKKEHILEDNRLMSEEYCFVERLDTDIQLHIIMELYSGDDNAIVEIKYAHNNISKIIKNGQILFEGNQDPSKYLGVFIDRSILNVNDIFDFANNVDINDVKRLLDKQIEYNITIAEEGLKGEYGVGIGKMLMKCYPNSIVTKLKVYAAAASEARMSGSSLPVMTNSGSGNQGMAASIPVIVYAREKGLSEEQLYRGLIFSNLMTIHQKTGIGRPSAFCGAVSAGCASGAAITYLEGGTLEQINKTVTNTLANISGIVCDGAKASCAAKIATSVDASMMGHYLAMEDQGYSPKTGILKESIEETITAVGRLGKEGMKETDKEILDIMLEE